MASDLAKARQILGDEVPGPGDDDTAAAPIPDIPHGPTHQRFASAYDTRPYTKSKLSSFLDRRNLQPSSSPRMLRHFHSSSNIPFGSHTNFPHSAGSSGRASFSFPNDGRSFGDEAEQPSSPRSQFEPLRSLSSVTTGQPWQHTLDQSRRSHKLGLAQLVSRRKPSTNFPYGNHIMQPSNVTSHTNSSHVSTHSLSNRGAPLVPSRLSSLTAQVRGEGEQQPETDEPKDAAFESTVPDVAKWFDGLAEPDGGPTSKHKHGKSSHAGSIRASSSRAPSITPSTASTFLKDGHSSGSEGEQGSQRRSGRRHRRRHSRGASAYTSTSSRRGSDAYSDRIVVTRRTKLRDSISRQGSVLSTSDSDESERSRILQIHIPRGSSRSRHQHQSPTAEVFYSDQRPSSRSRSMRNTDDGPYELDSRSRHGHDDGYESRPRTSRRDAYPESRPRSSRRQERGEDIIEISLPRDKSRHSQKSRRPSRASRWEEDADVPPIPAVIDKLATSGLDYKRVADPGPNADYRPPSRQPRHKSSSQSMVAQAVEESLRKRAEADPQYLSVTPAEARLLINMRKKKLAMQKQLFSEGYRHALEEELYQLEQMQASGKNKQARVDERSSFASMPDDVGYLGPQFPSPPNGPSSVEDRPIITDTIMESPSENDLSRSNSVDGRPAVSSPNSTTNRAQSTSRPSTAKRASNSPTAAETHPPMPSVTAQTAPQANAGANGGSFQQASRASTFIPGTSYSGAARANSLTASAFQPASRTNSLTSAAMAAANAARTKSLTSGITAVHGRNAGSRDLTKQQGRAVATRQPSWIRRSDEEPLVKYQSQVQQLEPTRASEPTQQLEPASPVPSQQPSPQISVEPSWAAESPIHPEFAQANPSEDTPATVEDQIPAAHASPASPQPEQPMPGSWRESGMSAISLSQHAYTQLNPGSSRPISEMETDGSRAFITPRDSMASSYMAPSPMTADTSEFSSVNGDDTSPRFTLVEADPADRRRETAVYSPVDPPQGTHERQLSGQSSIQVDLNDSAAPELSRSDTVVRVRDHSNSRSGTPLNYSLFPTQPKMPEQSVQNVAARRAQFEQAAAGQLQQQQPAAMPQTPEQKQARTAYASPAGSRSSSRVSKLPRMRGSSLPSIPVQSI